MKYLFYRLYKLAEKSKTSYSLKFVACNLFFTLIFFNSLSLILILEYFKIIVLTNVLGPNILILFFFVILFLIYLFFNYKDNYKKILNKYQLKEERSLLSFIFWTYIIISLLSPFALIFIMYVAPKL